MVNLEFFIFYALTVVICCALLWFGLALVTQPLSLFKIIVEALANMLLGVPGIFCDVTAIITRVVFTKAADSASQGLARVGHDMSRAVTPGGLTSASSSPPSTTQDAPWGVIYVASAISTGVAGGFGLAQQLAT